MWGRKVLLHVDWTLGPGEGLVAGLDEELEEDLSWCHLLLSLLRPHNQPINAVRAGSAAAPTVASLPSQTRCNGPSY